MASSKPVQATVKDKVWEVVLPEGTELLTPDFYNITLSKPVRVEIPDDAVAPIAGD
jgi:hypothetical protein